jgi:short-subunit dehydrogenase
MSARVVLVTGASSGIGRATARLAARRGHHLVLVARGRGGLEEAADECRADGAASVEMAPLDVGDGPAVEQLVADLVVRHGRVDAVVHSAGVVAYGRFEDIPAEVFDRVLRTNVLGSANVARAVLPHMRERDAGTLVLLSSVIGHIAAPLMTPYAVSKWGVRALGRQLQVENRDRPGVHVAVVAPGGVDTPIYVQAANYEGHVGRPPPPVLSAERVAEVCMGLLDRPRPQVQVGALNRFMSLGFALLPHVYDRAVGPLFSRLALDQRRPVEPHPGNVLAPAALPEEVR